MGTPVESGGNEEEQEDDDGTLQKDQQDLQYLILDVYKSIMIETVRFSHVITYLPFMKDHAMKIHKLEKESGSKYANQYFFEAFLESEEENKYVMLKDALKSAEFKMIYDAINKGGVSHLQEEYKNLLYVLLVEIKDRINPTRMAQDLLSRDIIIKDDEERIRKMEQTSTRSDAAFLLVDCLPRYKENWYEVFIELLIEDGQDELAKTVDPKIFGKLKEKYSDTADVESVESIGGKGTFSNSKQDLRHEDAHPMTLSDSSDNETENIFPYDTKLQDTIIKQLENQFELLRLEIASKFSSQTERIERLESKMDQIIFLMKDKT